MFYWMTLFAGYHFYVIQEQGVSYCIWAGLFLEMEILPTSDSDAEKLGDCVWCLT